MSNHNFLVLTFPAQGHINPSLQFSKRLLRLGLRVTFVTAVNATRRMASYTHLPEGLKIVDYSDGYDDGLKPGDDINHYWSETRRCGSEALRQLVSSATNGGSPYTCLVYSILLPWAVTVARDLHLPSALLWIQPATVFDIYYYFGHGFKDAIQELASSEASTATIEFPGLSLSFTKRDLPSFMIPNDPKKWALDIFQEHMVELHSETIPRVLVNTFDALEMDALTSFSIFKLTAIGPLIPSAFLDDQDPSDIVFGGDMMQETSHSHIEWLDSKPDLSVIYVSFGSFQVLSKPQMVEIARGLLETGKSFLWIIRKPEMKADEKDENFDKVQNEDDKWLSCIDELEQLGLMIPWCSQLQVLSHPAISCFLTHCGWNSTTESIVSGVPVVAFPQWSDQGTNAKLVEDYWKTGVRVTQKEDGLVDKDEVKRCLELVMGNEEMRKNAKNWKELAVEAVKDGGSSDKKLRDFINQFTT